MEFKSSEAPPVKPLSSSSRCSALRREYHLAVKRNRKNKNCTSAKIHLNWIILEVLCLLTLCVFTLMKQRRIYFSKSFVDSSPTNAVTGMAASFCIKHIYYHFFKKKHYRNTLLQYSRMKKYLPFL